MGIRTESHSEKPTVEITVMVQFMDGTLGDFKGTFQRLDQDRIDELLDPEENFSNSEIVDEVLVGVSGITTNGAELPADEQLAWVKKTPECVSAAVAAFFKKLRPERYAEKTSKRRRSRG